MTILRPDPAEYIEDWGCGPIRSVDVLCGTLGFASAHGLDLKQVYQAALAASSVRDFDRIVADLIDDKRRRVA